MTEYIGYDDALHGDDDYVGEDEILGAVARRGGRQPARKPQLQAASAPPKKLRGYLGLGNATFINGGPTQLTLTVEPQRSFRPERLIIDRTNVGAASPTLFANVVNIFVGDQPQSPSVEQPAPIAMFRADATVSGIDFDKAIPGQKIALQLSISAAPAVGETVTLSCGFYGDMLR